MTTRKQLKEKYKVLFWKEYSFDLKCMVWVCVDNYSGEFICEARTLKEIDKILAEAGHNQFKISYCKESWQ